MKSDLDNAGTMLSQGELLRMVDGQGQGIVVFTGSVWITQDADPRDIVLDAGHSFTLDRPGLTIVQALTDSVLLASAPARNDERQAVGGARPSAYEIHRTAQRMRSEAIGRGASMLATALRRAAERLWCRIVRIAGLGDPCAAEPPFSQLIGSRP
jgi:hypothetical protein